MDESVKLIGTIFLTPSKSTNSEEYDFSQQLDLILLLLKKHASIEPSSVTQLKSVHQSLPDTDIKYEVYEAKLHSPKPFNRGFKFSEEMQKEMKELGAELYIQKDSVFRSRKRLVVFDMDSTLIKQECIDELAGRAGVKDKVAAITEQAMAGQLDFTQSLHARLALLKDQPYSILEDLKPLLTFTEGARELCYILNRLGCKMAVVSGGFLPLAEFVKSELGLHHAEANQLDQSSEGQLTGTTIGEIVSAEKKREVLLHLAKLDNLDLDQVMAVGDGANDVLMMAASGLGVAFHAKPLVQVKADIAINHTSLLNILFFFGLDYQHIQELLIGF